MIAGLGAGWAPEEFRAVGVPIGERGRRLDESLDALEAYWGTNPVEHKGTFSNTAASYVDIKPVQRPGPSIYLPAFTAAGLNRVARRAKGIIPAVQPGGLEPTMLTGAMARVRETAAQAGRDPNELDVILRINTQAGDTVESIVETILLARDQASVDHVFVDFTFRDLATSVEHALELAGRVLEMARAR